MELCHVIRVTPLLWLCSSVAHAQEPPLIVNYQARLSHISGAAFVNGPVEVRIRIFDAATDGNEKWDSGEITVQVRDGVFSVLLQGGTPTLSNTVFAPGFRYLEVSVRQALTWTKLMPRQALASVPWAFWASTVSDGSITNTKLANDPESLSKVSGGTLQAVGPRIRLGEGITSNQFLMMIQGNSGGVNANIPGIYVKNTGGQAYLGLEGNSAGISYAAEIGLYDTGPNNSSWALGMNSSRDLYISNPSGNKVTVKPDGWIGLGTSNPQARLEVVGSIKGESLEVLGPIRAEFATGTIWGIETLGSHGGVHGTGPTYGVVGDGGQYGVFGRMDRDNNGAGVLGVATTTTGNSVGGYFISSSPSGRAIWATNSAAGGTAIFGQSASDGYAGYFVGNLFAGAKLGINTESPQARLHVNGDARVDSGLSVGGGVNVASGGIVVGAGGVTISSGGLAIPVAGIQVSGTVHRSENLANWDVNSDRRLKTKIVPVNSALESLLRLEGVTYEYLKEPGKMRRGFIAQSVQRVFPEWVHPDANGYLLLNMDGFDAIAVEAIREQQTQIEALKSMNRRLQSKISRLEVLESRLQEVEEVLRGLGKSKRERRH